MRRLQGMGALYRGLIGCVMVAWCTIPAVQGAGVEASGAAARPRVLFLGDRGHHQPGDRFAQIKPVLEARGIDVVYSENVGDLNPQTLQPYDAVLVYANIERIEPDQVEALIAYVESGRGFVPIHCASYCFLNSPRYIALVGAQFLRHGSGEFETKNTLANHPIIDKLTPFTTWDETYVHAMHNNDGRTVLQVRAEGATDEPWTWVRTQGKGRVFYTAYGHDYRTWQEPGFQDLLERGIRWAAGKGPVFDSRPKLTDGLPAFRYEGTSVEIPNYLSGQKWGTQGEALRRMQEPLSAEESRRHLVVPKGFESKLFAADPQIYKPLCMTWDERGRLWIAESVDYPNTVRANGETGRDRITVCEDVDRDGKADKFSVFAEGLNIPTSLLCANGGLIVLQSPDTLFLKDTDADGKADVRKVLFTGWGRRDTHAGPSNLRWGLDNWVWGVVGYSGFDGSVGGEAHRFAQSIFRFRADGSQLQAMRSTNNNTWGLGFSEEGLVFGSTANNCPSVYMPIPNRYYESVRGMAPGVLASIAPSNRFYPVTDKVRQMDWHGGFTAAAGHALYTARTYPREYWNSTAFVTEPTGHLIATFTLEPKATDFAAYYGWNLLASDDEWSAPIAAEVGPDGNVWVIDWYNYIVQHNPTPKGFKTGAGNAYETPLRDRTHGRIYRITHERDKSREWPELDVEKPDALVAALGNDNQLWRLHAQRLLVERGKTDVVPGLLTLLADQEVDAIGLNPGAIHALWVLHGLGLVDGAHREVRDAVTDALGHRSAGVRRNALQVMAGAGVPSPVVVVRHLADPDAQVRLAALLCLADLPGSRLAADAVHAALDDGLAEKDRWLEEAAIMAAARNSVEFLVAAISREKNPKRVNRSLNAVIGRVAESWARGGPANEAFGVLSLLSKASPAVSETIIEAMARGWPKGKSAVIAAGNESALMELAKGLTPKARGQLVRLTSQWGSHSLDAFGAEIVAGLVGTIRDDAGTDGARVDAAKQLIELRPTDEKTARAVLELMTPRSSPELVAGLMEALAGSSLARLGGSIAETLAVVTPGARSPIVRALLARADWTGALVTGLESGTVRITELALDQQQALANHPTSAIAERARQVLKRGGGLPDADRQKVIDQLTPLVSQGGDAVAGKLVFSQQCAKCHRRNGEGGQVGPDLSGTAALPRGELLIHILDPSRGVEGTFVQYTVATHEGRVLAGLLAGETRTTIELLDAEGKRHPISREDIDQIAASKKSLMPEGFEKQVTAVQLKDLLAFLTRRGKYLPLDLRPAATVVSTKGMFFEPDGKMERLVFADWGPKTVDGVPFLLVDPRGDRVANVVLLNGPLGNVPPKMPKSVSVTCQTPARAIHLLSGVSGWGYPLGRKGSVSLIVRVHYKDGSTEDHPLENGVHFADYIRVVDVPGSKLAFTLKDQQQIRTLAVYPKKSASIDRVEFVKGTDESAPIVMGVTIEAAGGE